MPGKPAQSDRRVAITGTGLATSLGLSRDDAWASILVGRTGIGPLTALEQPHDPAKGGGQAMDLPPGADNHAATSRESRYLRFTIDHALAEAGIDPAALPYPAQRCGIILGTTLHGMRAAGKYFRSDNPTDLQTFLAPVAIVQAAGHLGFKGHAATTCSACSSGLAAIAQAVSFLREGELDLVIAGGYDVVSEYAYAGFESLRLVTAGALRPFCRDRDGMKLSEGFGIVILERSADAAARKATIIAHVLGCGESADAHHLTQPHPQGAGAQLAITRALDDAQLSPTDIGMICAHATSTPDNDGGEYQALHHAFGDALANTPVVALKSHLGHTLGGAGAVELVLATKALEEATVPHTANVEPDCIEYPGLQLLTSPQRVDSLQHSLNLSMGFGGANSCVVLGRAGRDGVAAPSVMPRPVPNVITRRAPGNVCITGVGVIMPGAVGNDTFVEYLKRPAAKPLTRDSEPIADQAIAHLLDSRRSRRMSAYVKLTLAATVAAFADAGLTSEDGEGQNTCSMLGTMHGSASYSEAYYREVVAQGLAAGNPMYFAEGVPNAAAAHLSNLFNLRGSSQTLIGSRTAALQAMRLAVTRIATGETSRIILSAGEEVVPIVQVAYKACGMHADNSPAGDDSHRPHGAFVSDAGFVCSSGAVTLILESQRQAESREHVSSQPCRAIIDHCRTAALPPDDRRQIVRGLRRLYQGDGDTGPTSVISSANATWIDQAEAIALAGTGATVSTMYGHFGECFAVTPLAGIAAVLLTGTLPRLVTGAADNASESPSLAAQLHGVQPAAGSEPVDQLAVLCTDFNGLVASAHMKLTPRAAAAASRPGSTEALA